MNAINENKWTKCSDKMPYECGYDWVLVQFVDKDGFVGLPYIAEYGKVSKMWHTQFDDKSLDEYLNNSCFASSWKPIGKSPEWVKAYNK